jgi:hypothetical protein
MADESRSSGASWVIPSLRERVARYREHAAYFARLADAEPVETIRDQWKNLVRDYEYLVTTLEGDCTARRMN